MSNYKSAAAEKASNALLIVILVAVVAFAGWLASTSSKGVGGGIVLFISGLVFGAIPAALIFAGLDHVLSTSSRGAEQVDPKAAASPAPSSRAAPKRIPQNNPRICPHCGRASMRRLSGFCEGCGSLFYDNGIWIAGDMRDPVATYVWDEEKKEWGILTTRELRAKEERKAAEAQRRAADAERARLTSRPARPTPRLIRRASEAEELCAEWLRWMGFPGALVTPAGTDGGIDVIGPGSTGVIAAQVKFEAVSAGRPKLQELYGAGVAAGATTTAFFSSAGFTRQAQDWADQVGMALFEFSLDGSIVPANEHSRRLFEA
ncbi:MAG: restriction endonuclease [Nocardioides sp.]|nr:restriction endonuclease [Nocardioides sp.]